MTNSRLVGTAAKCFFLCRSCGLRTCSRVVWARREQQRVLADGGQASSISFFAAEHPRPYFQSTCSPTVRKQTWDSGLFARRGVMWSWGSEMEGEKAEG